MKVRELMERLHEIDERRERGEITREQAKEEKRQLLAEFGLRSTEGLCQ